MKRVRSRSGSRSTSRPRRRRLNPGAAGWTVIAVSVAAMVGLIASTASASSGGGGGGGGDKPKDLPDVGPDLPCDPAPYFVDDAELRAAIGAYIDDNELDKSVIATNVANGLYSDHPSGHTVHFPPNPANQMEGVECVWAIVVLVVDDEFRIRGIDGPVDPVTPTVGSLDWVLRSSGDPGYPWEEPVMQISNWPSPGMFVDIGTNDSWNPAQGYDSMIRAYLGTALAMADMDVGISTSTEGQVLRKQLRNAVMAVGGLNDLLYGQTNLNYAGGNDPTKPGGDANKQKSGQYVLNSEDRGLNWLPRHKNIKQLVQTEQPLKRATTINGSKIAGSAGGNQQMLVWLPAIDLDYLRENMEIRFLKWSDGSSTIDPPPQILGLGVSMSGVVLPGVGDP